MSSEPTAAAENPTPPPRRGLSVDEIQERLSYNLEKDRVYQGDLVQRFLEVFGAILKHSNYRQVLDNCARVTARCANCAPACQIYQQTGKQEDVPCHRSHLLLDVYTRHFTLRGMIEGRLRGVEPLSEERIVEMAETYYHCTACRRCTLECPLGVDHGLITHLARWVLAEIGLVPRALVLSVRAQLEGDNHNTSNIPWAAITDTAEFLAEEVEEDKGIKVYFPQDEQNRDYIFFPAVSDFIMEADTLMGMLAVFYAAGDLDNWTIGSKNQDGINYGLFFSDYYLERILQQEIDEARRLNAKNILIGECGHASRAAKGFVNTYAGGPEAPPVKHILEYTYEVWKSGKLKLDPNVITEKVTYHDPCNVARSGWIVEKPREIIKSFCKDYVEMTPGKSANLCCGGGGGTVSIEEVTPYRLDVTAAKKAEQLKATGAKYLIAPCANCKKQLRLVVDHYDLDMEVVGLHDLIYKAIVLDEAAAGGE